MGCHRVGMYKETGDIRGIMVSIILLRAISQTKDGSGQPDSTFAAGDIVVRQHRSKVMVFGSNRVASASD